MHAQYDAAAHAKAIRKGAYFDTYGNLSGTPWSGTYAPSTGRMYGAARAAIREHGEAGEIRYILWSYRTPIAWLTADDVWHIDDTRHGAASDQALSAARKTIDMIGHTIRVYNHRHHMTPAQLELAHELTTPYRVSGRARRSLSVLIRRGIATETERGEFVLTDVGHAYLTGAPLLARWRI